MSTAQMPPKVTHGPAVDSWPQWVSGGRDDTSEAAPAGATSRRMVTALATARRTARWTARLNAEPRRLGRRVRERWRLMQPRDSEAAEAAAGGSHIVQQGLRRSEGISGGSRGQVAPHWPRGVHGAVTMAPHGFCLELGLGIVPFTPTISLASVVFPGRSRPSTSTRSDDRRVSPSRSSHGRC
jgi:hypothetical protein